MYSTCYHCLGALGRNAAVAPFPVGRRLAFDAARGRLWAVCPACGRWNLAPLEERWGAVDACERLFRRARRRYGTANVGLAQLADGTELVRIGPALRPELAAWRYGGRLLRARRRGAPVLVRAAAAGAAGVARTARWLTGARGGATPEERGLRVALAGPGRHAERVLAVARAGDVWPEGVRPNAGPDLRPNARSNAGPNSMPNAERGARRPGRPAADDALPIRRRHVAGAVLVRPDEGDPWRLEVPHERGLVCLAGAGGLRAAAALLAAVNAHGVTPHAVDAAVRKVEEAADPDGYFNRVLHSAWRWHWGRVPPGAGTRAPAAPGAEEDVTGRLAVSLTGRAFWGRGGVGSAERQLLLRTPLVDRLALEMAAHEDAERAALAESLAALEAAWREAEELARIVDAL